MSKIDQDVSPIPQHNNSNRQQYKYKNITNIGIQDEDNNYQQQKQNLHVSMDPLTLKDLGRRKKPNFTRNSSIRSNAYSVRTNV